MESKLEPCQRQELLTCYARRDNVFAIAERFGVSRRYVTDMARQYRVKRGQAKVPNLSELGGAPEAIGLHRDACRAVRRGFTIPREREPEFIALLIQGHSREAAARKMGVL